MKCTTGRKHTIVLHGVQAALGENGHLHRREGGLNSPGAILIDHPRGRVTRDGDDEVVGTLMSMRRQHGAGSQIEGREGHA